MLNSAGVYKETLADIFDSLPDSINHLEVAVVIPATDIANLNLDALVIFTEFLAERFSVSYVPITNRISSPQRLGHSTDSKFGDVESKYLIASISDYSSENGISSFPDLPGAAIESQILVDLFPSLMTGSVTDDLNSNIITIQNSATASWLTSGNIDNNNIDGQPPQFIHMSLHSKSSEETVDNGFLLPDGNGTDFSEVRLDNVELIFLNTCQSGHIRYDQNNISLAHSAILHGTENVIAPT